ncbi:glucuronate isomerase [Persicobacter diffluens]|uniref:Uronate isomerase n=1 Tax=Persicobacter diffluens TaxID=981 RepID=A0AAN4W4P5_9BACT|nr:uronate isomerase [Persicobacter diffluens]
MNNFIKDDFLLESETAQQLYTQFAAPAPIIDYHCHLSPKDIAENRCFNNITEAWLEGDHYKWRAMRTLGLDESFCTGQQSAKDKFVAWAKTVPYTMRNPLYHWTHLELKRYFGVDEILNEESAERIYEKTSRLLSENADFSTRGLLKKMNVKVVCTTDDPLDELQYHRMNNATNDFTKIFPTWRPDKAININKGEEFLIYIQKLSKVSENQIDSFAAFLEALEIRMKHFDAHHCRMSDHGVEQIHAEDYQTEEVEVIFQKALQAGDLSDAEIGKYKSAIFYELGIRYHKFGWAQQYHLGALRDNSIRQYENLGPDTGFDSIGDWPQAESLSRFLGKLDHNDQLAKTIIYNLNPADNYVIGTMIGNFQGEVAGKIQFGSGWWFLDQKEGMEWQLNALSNLGLLPCFIGMLTDSRSFLSFPRHEYFRRILCNLFGKEIEAGLLPNDLDWIGQIIQNICYYNVKDYAFSLIEAYQD